MLVSVETKEQQGDIVDGHVADSCKKAESLLQGMRNKDTMGQSGREGTEKTLSCLVPSYAKVHFWGIAKLTVWVTMSRCRSSCVANSMSCGRKSDIMYNVREWDN